MVKGTIAQAEQYGQAAIRELFEESGLIVQSNPELIGNFILKCNQQDWYFYLCQINRDVPETWLHYCQDDGGLEFEFFYYPLHQKPSEDWHETFQEALLFLRKSLII